MWREQGLVSFLLFTAAFASSIPRKQLGGPPSEFQKHVLPQPVQSGVQQYSALLATPLEQTADGAVSATLSLPVDSSTRFAFTVFSDLLDHLDLTLKTPTGGSVWLWLHEFKSDLPLSDDNSLSVPGKTFVFVWPFIHQGSYTLTVRSKDGVAADVLAAGTQAVSVNLFNFDGVRVFTYLNSYLGSTVGQSIGLVTRITMDEEWQRNVSPGAPRALQGVIVSADMDLVLPNGSALDVQMHDDGLHADGEANDGVFGATVTAPAPGSYIATAFIKGEVNGTQFVRSTQQVIAVVNDTLDFTGVASSVTSGQQRLLINVAVTGPSSDTYRAYAEVWGTAADGSDIPVAWIGGVVDVVEADGDNVVQLELDLQWAARAKASAPFTLRNAVLQDIVSFVPVADFDQIPVAAPADLDGVKQVLLRLSKKPEVDTEITEEMRWGVRPAKFARRPTPTADADLASMPLVMSHGYCAGRNPWQVNAQDFPNAFFFADFKANRPHDEFAQLIAAFAEDQNLTAWAAVAHSQGGVAMLHLHNYYWSGLEVPTTGRLIQSVGSPYLGCTGAGSAAGVARLFGVGCGSNADFSLDGARLWYAGISAAAEADVYYFTTTYKQKQFFGDYCNIAVNLVLEWPNDGTAELAYAKLPNGNYQGNTESECHTQSMKYKAQYEDTGRNKIINANRGR